LLNIAQDRRPCYRPGHLADPHPVRRGPLSGFVPSGVAPWRTTVGVGCGRVFTRPTSFRRPSSSPGARIFRSGPWSRTFRFEAFGRRPRGRDLGAGTARGGRAWFLVPPEGGARGPSPPRPWWASCEVHRVRSITVSAVRRPGIRSNTFVFGLTLLRRPILALVPGSFDPGPGPVPFGARPSVVDLGGRDLEPERLAAFRAGLPD